MRRQSHCALGRERIHGYLDGALSEVEMEQVAAHVAACEDCREEMAQFRVLKAALNEMRTPAGSGEARDRVFSRYRETAPARRDPVPARPAAVTAHHWSRHSSLTFAAAAAAAALIAFLPPVAPSSFRPALLPGPVEMSLLSERHDLHVAHAELGSGLKGARKPISKGRGTGE